MRGEIKSYTHAEWVARAVVLFGKRAEDWRFMCPSCGHVQTIRRLMDAGLTKEVARNVVYQACEGRIEGTEAGCNWCLFGLFRIHRAEVKFKEGERPVPVFEFDEPGAAPSTEPGGTPRPEILWFARRMEEKLHHHDKGRGDDWKHEDNAFFLRRMRDELVEVEKAADTSFAEYPDVHRALKKEIVQECADLANFCMMLAWTCRNHENS